MQFWPGPQRSACLRLGDGLRHGQSLSPEVQPSNKSFRVGKKFVSLGRGRFGKSTGFKFLDDMNAVKFQTMLLGNDAGLAESLLHSIQQDGGALETVADYGAALNHLQNQVLDVVFLDLKSSEADCLNLLRQFKHHPPPLPVITVGFGPAGDHAAAMRAFELGMNEHFPTPFEKGIFRARLGGVVLLKRTLEELTRRQRELTEACRVAEANSRAKSDFLAAMSHEIRTPMNGVIAMTGLLMESNLTSEQRAYLETIHSSSESLLEIINDILDFSKIEAGKMELENRPFDLRSIIEESLDLLAVRASEKRLDVVYEVDDAIPELVEGDSQRLRQVLVNLVGNALKFTERGGVAVKVEKIAPAAGGENAQSMQLHFSVRDSGIGISPDRLTKLFRPFVQADASTSRKYGGTGLGLVISRRLVELMGGRMWAESVPGEGSTFHFTANLSVSANAAPASAIMSRCLADLRVLILEDGEMARNFLAGQCRRWGMVPQVVDSSAAAMSLLHKGETFDLALVDAQLPDVDGAAVAVEMQKIPAAAMMPVVFMAAPGGSNESTGDTKVMFAHSVNKPVKPAQLRTVLEGSLLSARRSAVRAETPKPELSLAQRFPLRILLVDDNAINQKVAVRIMQQMGYHPCVATNGREAVDFIEREPFDIVFMDVMMPEMDGLEATRVIRERQAGGGNRHFQSHIVIIAMTAHAMQGDREKCISAGMDDYLSKPVRPKDVREMVERWGGKIELAPPPALPAAASAEEELPVDMSRMNDLTDGNADSLRELVEIFFKQTQGQFTQLRTAISDGNADQVRRVAHSCAGASATLGMNRLAPLMRQLEKLGASGTLTGAADICENAAREFECIRGFLKAKPELAAIIPDPNPA